MDLPMVHAMAVQSVGVGGDVVDIVLDFFRDGSNARGADRYTCDNPSNPILLQTGGSNREVSKSIFISDIRILSEIFRCYKSRNLFRLYHKYY